MKAEGPDRIGIIDEPSEGENRFEGETGTQFEEHMLPPLYCRWDGRRWREDQPHRDEILFDWLKKEVLPEMGEKRIREALNIPKGSANNPRRTSTLNEQRIFSAWKRLSREERMNLILKWCENHPPKEWDPKNPLRKNEVGMVLNRDMASLHGYVLKELEQSGEIDDQTKHLVKLFPALRTPADDISGIDAFYDFKGAIVTLDITKNKSKSDFGLGNEKADIPVTDIDMSSEDGKKVLAKSIARVLKERHERLNEKRDIKVA